MQYDNRYVSRQWLPDWNVLLKSQVLIGESCMKSRINFVFQLLLSATLAATASTAIAEIYTLGDSMSDAGALGITYTNPDSITPFVPGKIWIQYLTTSTPAFCGNQNQCPWNPSTFYYGAGNNYAVGGAGVVFDSTDARTPNTYTSLGSQVSALINSGKLRKGDTITVIMGANDILAAASKPSKDPAAAVGQAASAYVQYISSLANQTSNPRVYAFTLPDIGKTPLGLSAGDGGTYLTQLTNIYNTAITTGLAKTPGVTMVNSAALYGELTKQLLTYPSYCLKVIDVTHVCGSSTNPVFSSQNNLLFADPLHASRGAQQMIASWLVKNGLVVKQNGLP
jgi:phospholipase/lecithinase/hemolysin